MCVYQLHQTSSLEITALATFTAFIIVKKSCTPAFILKAENKILVLKLEKPWNINQYDFDIKPFFRPVP